jgi:valyl-tRNA synthetase
MALDKHYNPNEVEPRLQSFWQKTGVYHFDPKGSSQVYSIDTPPPTVSGHLHLGHVYSYSHTDFIARFWRMNGRNVFYPMGFDDNGLPTERLVEKRLGISAIDIGRRAFIEKCLQVSEEVEADYRNLWQRLGLSIDWRYTYRTIDQNSLRSSQLSFIDLYRHGLVDHREAPAIWCPECRTSIAQAELNDLERESEFITLPFRFNDGQILPIATTRPELLPACVAVFVHPSDERYRGLVGKKVIVPFYEREVPILSDPGADPEKGTGAVMCCTFGDTADVAWWYAHNLPLISIVGCDGRLTEAAGQIAGLSLDQGRQRIKQLLESNGLILGRQPVLQSVRVHERCDTPVEYILTPQWFIRVLDSKQALLEAGEKVRWYPEHMQVRYRTWVENLNWDWCISRQRYFGVPFPLWYCRHCGEVILAEEEQLPVDPLTQSPNRPCPRCGSAEFEPEKDVLDTWATSSLSPQIVGRWLVDSSLYTKVFPFSLRPQAQEIIRTWAFYTIVKSKYHFDVLPWENVAISGWGIAGEGMGKISKSRGGGPMPPLEMIERYSADAVRYWAASTGPGKDAVISEEKIQMGAKFVTKLWNVARFAERFLESYQPVQKLETLSAADQWILSRLQKLIRRATQCFQAYDYATAKSEIETFFWTELTDNYLEMCKQRLYTKQGSDYEGACFTLYQVLLATLKLCAPFFPYISEEIYLELFAQGDGCNSIHVSSWPVAEPGLEDEQAEMIGEIMVDIARAVRRYKSEHNFPLGMELSRVQLVAVDADKSIPDDVDLAEVLQAASADLISITRARQIEVGTKLDQSLHEIESDGNVRIGVE